MNLKSNIYINESIHVYINHTLNTYLDMSITKFIIRTLQFTMHTARRTVYVQCMTYTICF